MPKGPSGKNRPTEAIFVAGPIAGRRGSTEEARHLQTSQQTTPKDNYRHDPEARVVEAEKAVLRLVREKVPTATLKRIGPLDFGQGASWSCWVVTPTDRERDSLGHDGPFIDCLYAEGKKAGFMPDGFAFQSEETVARDYEGSWFYAMR
jgi:hypothetical protein